MPRILAEMSAYKWRSEPRTLPRWDAQEPQSQALGGLFIGSGESMTQLLTLQAWFRMWECGPLCGAVGRLQGHPLIKVLLEPSVQAAGENHPADLPDGENRERRDMRIPQAAD